MTAKRKWSAQTIAKRARAKACKLKVFERELGYRLDEDWLDLRPQPDSPFSAWGKAGFTGWVNFGPKVNPVRLQEVIIHELCHVVLWRASRGWPKARRKKWRSHGQNFRGLLMAACAEFFKMTKDEERAVRERFERLKERQRADRALYGTDRTRHAYLLDDAIQTVLRERDLTG